MKFLDLPEDLSIALLSEWLHNNTLINLSRLDIACCSHASRQCWLQVLRGIRIKTAEAAKPLSNFLMWLYHRDVFVNDLGIRMGEEDWDGLTNLSLRFKTTSLFCFRVYRQDIPQSISALMSFFPCLTSLHLDCLRFVDGVFPDLTSCFSLPLRQLSLRSCEKVDMSNALLLLSAVGSTLEELCYDSVDEPTMVTVAAHCKQLKKLTCSFHFAMTAASVIIMFGNTCQLSYVNFDGMMLITNELILSILTVCPSIKEVELGPYCSVTLHLLSSHSVQLLKSCNIWPLECHFFPCDSDSTERCCDIVDTNLQYWAELHSFFLEKTISLRGISFRKRDNVEVTANVLRALVDSHGRTLQKCELFLRCDMTQADLQYFLSHCPNMVELSLTSDSQGLIDDADMYNLPLWCPLISRMELIDCAVAVTDQSLSYALDRWSANHITSITLHGCGLLTDAVLPVIERCCPQLTSLSLLNTNISKEAVQQFVQSISKNKVFSSMEANFQ